MPWNDSIVAFFILSSTDGQLTLYFTISWGWSSPCHAKDQSAWCNQSGRQYKVFIAIIQSNNYLLIFCLPISILDTVGNECTDGRILSLSSWITYLGKEAGHLPLNKTALCQTKPGSQGLPGTWGWGRLCVCVCFTGSSWQMCPWRITKCWPARGESGCILCGHSVVAWSSYHVGPPQMTGAIFISSQRVCSF